MSLVKEITALEKKMFALGVREEDIVEKLVWEYIFYILW